MNRPKISGARIWENHERRVLAIFTRALELLRAGPDLDTCEDRLNRRLLFCVRKANAEFADCSEGIDCPVTYEGNNQPDTADEERAARESKRPDFQWGFVDRTEEHPCRQDKFYVIECKRLGKPLRKNWVFNENYVKHGVVRFVKREHGYGMSSPSAAMIGYISNMSPDDILKEVNNHATSVSLSPIDLPDGGWINHGVSRLDQSLEGREVSPTTFKLRHLWADLRQT